MMIKKGKNTLEINRIGNKHCWIKNGFQHWWFFNRGGLLIWGDHLFLNYIFFWGSGGWLIGRGLLILTWHYSIWYVYIYIYMQMHKQNNTMFGSFPNENPMDFHRNFWEKPIISGSLQ